jgi:hypothetical protein
MTNKWQQPVVAEVVASKFARVVESSRFDSDSEN